MALLPLVPGTVNSKYRIRTTFWAKAALSSLKPERGFILGIDKFSRIYRIYNTELNSIEYRNITVVKGASCMM